MHVRLIEARTDAQFGLGSEHRYLGVGVAVQVQQASGAERAPHTTKAGTDDQNALFHVYLQRGKVVVFERARTGIDAWLRLW
ncbi:hypothetical protein D3C78_1423230 [compost metagenome]